MTRGYFVTGTDTGVGKTVIACALMHAFAATGRSVVGMKPVAAGRENGVFEDVEALLRASDVDAPMNLINPYSFDAPIAPHVAAALEGVKIDVEVIARACDELTRLADVVIVEGAGGFMIPLNATRTSADLAQALNLPVVLVVGMRLGCLNHALLTREAIEARGLQCAGWVANCIEPAMPHLEANLRTLDDRLNCPRLGLVPYSPKPDPHNVAQLLVLDRMTETSG